MNLFELYAKIVLDPSDYENGIASALTKTKSFAETLESKMKAAAKAVSVAIGAATTAVTAFAKASIDVGKSFDAAMSEVAAISGATGAEFDALREKALEMGSITKFSATESAEALKYMAMAGWKTEDMLAGLEGIMNLAAASGENLGATSDIVTDALTAFGMSAEQSGHFADVLAAASSNANTNVGLLGDSFRYVAPVAGALGYTAEDTAVALGLMANSGIKASQAGTSLRAALSSMLDATNPTMAAMEQIGLATDGVVTALVNTDGTTKTLAETMGILRDKFAELTQAEQAEYAAQIFGREAMSGMLAIVNTSEAEYQKLATAIYNAEGAAQEMATVMIDNLAGDMENFQGAVESARISLSDKLTPTLREVVQFGTEMVGVLVDKLSPAIEKAAKKIADFIMGINVEDAVDAIGSLIQTFVDLLPVITGVTAAVGAYKAAMAISHVIEGVKAAIAALTGVTQAQTTAQTLLNGVMAANPFVAVATAVAAVTAALVTLWATNEDFRSAVGAIWDAIKGVFSTAWEGIKSVWDAAVGFFEGVWKGISGAFIGVADFFGGVFSTAWEGVTAIWEGAADFFSGVWDGVTGVFSGVADFFGEVFSKAWEAVKSVWDGVTDFFQGIVDNIVGAFSGIFDTFKGIGGDIVRGIWDGITGLAQWLGERVEGFFDGIVSGVMKLLGMNSPSKVFAGIGKNMVLGLAEGWNDEYRGIKRQIENGMHFDTASVDISARGSYGGAGMAGMGGGDTYNFYSPKALDPVSAAREMKRAKQQMALGYI